MSIKSIRIDSDTIKVTKNKRIGFLLVIFLLFSTYPFVFNLLYPLPSITILMLANFTVFVSLLLLKVVTTPKKLYQIIAVQFIATTISFAVTKDTEYFKQYLYILSGFIMVAYIKTIGFKLFLLCYNRLILIVAILGTVSSILTILFGDRVFLEYINMDGRPGWLVYFTFTNTNSGSFIRYSGIFDEPGAMAFWGMFALIFNKIYVHDKYLEIPLIVCLLFTYSVAFIIQIMFYLLLFYGLAAKFRKKMIVSFCALVAVFFSYQLLDKSSDIYMLTFGRLGIGTTYNMFEDSTRAHLTELARNTFLTSPLFGIGPTKFYGGVYMADNPYETLAKDGIFGTIFLYLPLIKTFSWGMKRKEVLFASFIILIGYLQRPFHTNFIHYTMLYLFFYIAYLQKNNRRVKNVHV